MISGMVKSADFFLVLILHYWLLLLGVQTTVARRVRFQLLISLCHLAC